MYTACDLGKLESQYSTVSISMYRQSQERQAAWKRMSEVGRQQFVWPQPGESRTEEDLARGQKVRLAVCTLLRHIDNNFE